MKIINKLTACSLLLFCIGTACPIQSSAKTATPTVFLTPQTEMLKGYHYGKQEAPEGTEWNSPENIALNKELPRAYFFSFKTMEEAKKVLPEHSSYYINLNGTRN